MGFNLCCCFLFLCFSAKNKRANAQTDDQSDHDHHDETRHVAGEQFAVGGQGREAETADQDRGAGENAAADGGGQGAAQAAEQRVESVGGGELAARGVGVDVSQSLVLGIVRSAAHDAMGDPRT